MRWHGRVDELLLDGETITARVDVHSAHVVVTNQRVLAFTPESPGTNFTKTDRPNVDQVTRGRSVSLRFLVNVGSFAALGLFLIALGRMLNLGGMADSPSVDDTDAVGGDSLFESFETVASIFGLIDTVFQFLGFTLLLGTVVYTGYYWHRTGGGANILIETAGNEADVSLPVTENPSETIRELDAALFDLDGSPAGGSRQTETASGFVPDSRER